MRITLMAAAMLAAVVSLAQAQQTLPDQPVAGEANAAVALDRVIDVDLERAPAKAVFQYIAQVGSLNLVADWKRLAQGGIDVEQPINVILRNVTVARALKAALMQMGDAKELMFELHPSYVQLMTKEQANQNVVVKVYVIGDLLHRVPQFTDAPTFDLSKISDSGSSNSGMFNQDRGDSGAEERSRTERGDQIADLIRRTIEPDIWEANGGTVGRISYHDGRLIVRAPEYVHRQIGLSETDMFLRRQAAVRLVQPQAYGPRVGVYNGTGSFSSSASSSSSGLYVNITGQGATVGGDYSQAYRASRYYYYQPGGVSSYNVANPNSYYNRPSGSGVAGIGR